MAISPAKAVEDQCLWPARRLCRGQHQGSPWTAQIWGHNLTNRYYWASQNAFLESIVRYAGMPVTYGASLSFRY
jgi:hypothetical protein